MSHDTGYDKALLDEAPEISAQQRQRFYDADILNSPEREQERGLPENAAAPTLNAGSGDLEAGRMHNVGSKEYAPLPPPSVSRRTPWYKTRKGVIGLVILAIVIIAAVVGGAVGGTRHSSNSNKSATGDGNGGTASQAVSNSSGSAASSTVNGPSASTGVVSANGPQVTSSGDGGANQGVSSSTTGAQQGASPSPVSGDGSPQQSESTTSVDSGVAAQAGGGGRT